MSLVLPAQRTLCHCNRLVITIFSQGIPSGRLPRYARNDTVLRTQSVKFYLHHFNGLIDVLSLCYSVQRTLCHSEELRCNDVRIPRKGYHIKPHARYFCTCVEKKAQTSIRVSVIAPDNVISKAQLSGTPRDTVYPWGKGAHKQKSEHYRPR